MYTIELIIYYITRGVVNKFYEYPFSDFSERIMKVQIHSIRKDSESWNHVILTGSNEKCLIKIELEISSFSLKCRNLFSFSQEKFDIFLLLTASQNTHDLMN